jgi:hypothetical protein
MRKLNKSERLRLRQLEAIIDLLMQIGIYYEKFEPKSDFYKQIKDEYFEYTVEWEILTGEVFDEDYEG